MKLGIMSDSHGRAGMVRAALKILDDAGAQAFVHCGDIGDLDILEEFAGRRLWFVWGNMDSPQASWRAELDSLKLPWPEGKVELQLDDKSIGIFHGHEPGFRQILQEAPYDYLLHGHTHHRTDYYVNRMRVINPGSLHRSAIKTVALLDPGTNDIQFFEVPD